MNEIEDKSYFQIQWDNFKLFCNELYELILEDLYNFIQFLKANKQYFIYGVILVILSQIVSINSLGESARKYCNKTIQHGGSAAAANRLTKANIRSQAKNLLGSMTHEDKSKLISEKMKMEKESKIAKTLKKKSEFEKNKARISFFQQMKQKFQPGGWFGRFGALGPVFGNMEAIMDSVKWLFAFMAIVALVVGIISIPVIIFMVFTYLVIKSLLRKFVIL